MSPMERRSILASGDVVAIVAFTVIGLISHEDGVTIRGVLEVAGPIVLVGAVTALLFQTYRRPGIRTLLPTWLVAVPGGILLRKALFGEPSAWGSTGVFVLVALAFTLLFLLAWRLVAHRLVGEPSNLQ
jgi:Protein of unknown function (DUF3054)